ncbi:MAG: OmpH family outer membrane protein [Acidobacteria bacterium]|nr:OmpH family outer membrane protein [Acidobacteriota bacterium]
MNHRLFVTALTAGALSLSSVMIAQAAGPQAPAASAPAAAAPAVKPEAIPAKIALIAFEQAVFATNEGQAAVAGVQKKYEPQRAKIEALGQEVDSLKKQLQAATNLSDEDRATRVRTIDTKEKQLNREGEDASTAYQQELQEAYGKVATKVADVMRQYVSQNGYTLLLDVSGQQSPVMWAAQQTDITRAVIDAYNTKSGVAAPPPAAPRPSAQHSTTPHKAAPKK